MWGRPLLKVVFLLAYLIAGLPQMAARLSAISPGAIPVFLVLYGLCVAGLVGAAVVRYPVLRIVLAMLMASASVFQLSYEGAAAGPLNYGIAVDLVYEGHQLGPALATYGIAILKAGCVSLCLFLAIALPPPVRRRCPARYALLPVVAASLLLSGVVWQRGGFGTEGLPAAYPPLVYAGLMALDEVSKDVGTRPGLTGPPKTRRLAQDIVLIVDESVSGNYLDLTNADGVRSGLTEHRPRIRVINFGYAASIGICSTSSNRVLRFGGTQKNFHAAVVHWPSIWRYAHRAGMRTVYIDAQMTGGARQNRMTAREAADIDIHHQFDGVPVVLRDHKAADLIAAYSRNGRPDFIYLNKAGAHFPLTNKYPASAIHYRPVPRPQGFAERAFADVLQSGIRTEGWRLYRNAYRNALRWSVGEFFDQLLAEIDLRHATILYTSDHGQDLHERGNPGANTHCGTGSTAQEQGVVPLAIIEGDGRRTFDWQASLSANYDRASAFRIFPTMLALMGYDRAAIRRDYGHPLDERPDNEFAFVEDFQALGGTSPRFRLIDGSQIVRPPRTDFEPLPVPR